MIGYDFGHLKDGDTLYICNSAIPFFKAMVFPRIAVRFRLVSGDSDNTSPFDLFANHESFLSFIEDPRIIVWYSQNSVYTAHPKFHQLPIGLDYHTITSDPLTQESQLDEIKSRAKPFSQRECKAHANFHFNMTTRFAKDRIDAFETIPKDLVYYEPEKCDRERTWETQSKYAFVISPHGNGLDCHRTWEALCLGCIPIVKTSGLDPMYAGLPVLIVSDWSVVTKELLETTMQEYASREFNYEKLLLSYWMSKIHE
jgi:hypothetical protein